MKTTNKCAADQKIDIAEEHDQHGLLLPPQQSEQNQPQHQQQLQQQQDILPKPGPGKTPGAP